MIASELHSEISPSDILYILENPWEKSKGEWLLDTESERQDTLQYINGLLQKGQEQGFSKLWKTDKLQPIALLGAFKVSEKRYETFFICSQHMEAHGLKLSFDMRKILKELSFLYKGCILGQYAKPGRTDQRSWFRFLGFVYKPEGDRGNTHYYEYVSATK